MQWNNNGIRSSNVNHDVIVFIISNWAYGICVEIVFVFCFITAILWALLFILLVYIVIKLLEQAKQYFISRQACTASTCQLDNDMASTQTALQTAATSTTAQAAAAAMIAQKKISSRLCSLDAFRGLAIVTMVFANSGCGKYYWIEHATWNGIHPADFIFPSFLWIMGVCIPFSLKSQFDKNIPRQDILGNILIVCSPFSRFRVWKHLTFGFFPLAFDQTIFRRPFDSHGSWSRHAWHSYNGSTATLRHRIFGGCNDTHTALPASVHRPWRGNTDMAKHVPRYYIAFNTLDHYACHYDCTFGDNFCAAS